MRSFRQEQTLKPCTRWYFPCNPQPEQLILAESSYFQLPAPFNNRLVQPFAPVKVKLVIHGSGPALSLTVFV